MQAPISGTNPTGECAAFERPDSCLYEAVMLKYRLVARHLGGPPSELPLAAEPGLPGNAGGGEVGRHGIDEPRADHP